MINSRDINDLETIVQPYCNAFIKKCKTQGIDILVYSTFRDNAQQDSIYAIGRTVKGSNPTKSKPMGSIVTNAKGGESFHNYHVAFDWVPVIGGKPQWNDSVLYLKCGNIAESCGLEWAGRWIKLKETAHCQFTGGHDLAWFKAGNKL